MHRWVDHAEQQVWNHTEDHDCNEQRRPGNPFELVDVFKLAVPVIVGAMRTASKLGFGFAKGNALEEPQQICSRKHGAKRCYHHVYAEDRDIETFGWVVGRENCRKLAPETGKAWQAERGHAGHAQYPAHAWHLRK